MELLDFAAVLLTLAAVFGYINLKLFKLPTTIGIMLIGLIMSALLLLLHDAIPAIADAADKYSVPTVKVTGGHRIDLFGVRGDDSPAIWAGRSWRRCSRLIPT